MVKLEWLEKLQQEERENNLQHNMDNMLTDKQLKEFIERYKSIYGDTSKETGTGELPHIKAEEEEEHIKMRKDFLKKLIGPRKCMRVYIHKGGRKDTRLGKVFEELRLYCGPVVDNKKDIS